MNCEEHVSSWIVFINRNDSFFHILTSLRLHIIERDLSSDLDHRDHFCPNVIQMRVRRSFEEVVVHVHRLASLRTVFSCKLHRCLPHSVKVRSRRWRQPTSNCPRVYRTAETKIDPLDANRLFDVTLSASRLLKVIRLKNAVLKMRHRTHSGSFTLRRIH